MFWRRNISCSCECKGQNVVTGAMGEARSVSEGTQAKTKKWAASAVEPAQVKFHAAAANAFDPAEDAIAPAELATYVPMGRAARLQERSEGAALRRRVSFGGVQAPAHLRKGPASSARQSTFLHSTPSAHHEDSFRTSTLPTPFPVLLLQGVAMARTSSNFSHTSLCNELKKDLQEDCSSKRKSSQSYGLLVGSTLGGL